MLKTIDRIKSELSITELDDDYMSEEYVKLGAAALPFRPKRVESITNKLLSQVFVIFKITDELEFVTSDNPVMLMNCRDMSVTPFKNAIEDGATIIYYPLSPKLILTIFSQDYYLGRLSCIEDKIVFINKEDKEFINTVNTKQLEQCYDKIYSREYSTLKKIKNSNISQNN